MKIPEGDFDAYIFDCDGTLADTMPLHYKAWCAALREHEADFPEALFYEFGGMPTERIVELLNERHGYSLSPAETAQKKEVLFLAMLAEIDPIEPVVAIVREVSGRLPMAVASGGPRDVVTRTLDALGLLGKFAAIVCSEDYARGKPAPDPFLLAAQRLGVEPAKCLVFEDTLIGEQAARAAGMVSVLVPPPERVQALRRAAAAVTKESADRRAP
ncbi:MAG: HAD family phosphatase [Verrucomicrobiota bacterium]|nr:HAD family phosphatase [Verrucomicrobiota bacterium]